MGCCSGLLLLQPVVWIVRYDFHFRPRHTAHAQDYNWIVSTLLSSDDDTTASFLSTSPSGVTTCNWAIALKALLRCSIVVVVCVAPYYCTVLLHRIIAPYCCTILLHRTVAPYYCTILLHHTVAPYYCTVLLDHTIALLPYYLCTVLYSTRTRTGGADGTMHTYWYVLCVVWMWNMGVRQAGASARSQRYDLLCCCVKERSQSYIRPLHTTLIRTLLLQQQEPLTSHHTHTPHTPHKKERIASVLHVDSSQNLPLLSSLFFFFY